MSLHAVFTALLCSGPEESPPAPSSVVSGSRRMETGIKYCLLALINTGFIAENIWLSQGTTQHHVFFSLFSGLFLPFCLLALWNQNIRQEGKMCELFSFQSNLPLLRCICYPGLLRSTLPFSCSIFHFCLFFIPNFIFSLFSFSAFLFLYIFFLSLPVLILLLITHLI